MIAVAFDRILKPWMTINRGGDDERVEWPEIDWMLVDHVNRPGGPTLAAPQTTVPAASR